MDTHAKVCACVDLVVMYLGQVGDNGGSESEDQEDGGFRRGRVCMSTRKRGRLPGGIGTAYRTQ